MTPATEETDLAHVYGENGTQYIVDVRHGGCTCDDYTYRHEGEERRCKHGHRTFVVVNGAASLPEWADVDVVDRMLRRRLDANREGERVNEPAFTFALSLVVAVATFARTRCRRVRHRPPPRTIGR